MTSDMDEGNDTINIQINEGNEHKQFFEKGLNALLSNPNFLLLYVPENGSKMQIIRPASDSYHRRCMIRRINEAVEGIPSFYYALSHLWGITENNRHYWNDIGEYVDNEDGQPVKPVSMRPEKRDTLLAMLKDHPDSYWWIDVLCARTDTPLDIMGDIYACCLECIAMIDCEPGLISQLKTSMGLIEYSAKNDATHQFDEIRHLLKLLFTLVQSKWWERVWTWQEMALPVGEVRLTAETGGHVTRNTISLDSLGETYDIIFIALALEEQQLTMPISNNAIGDAHLVTKLDKLLTWVSEIFYARRFNMGRIRYKNDPGFDGLIDSLARSTRRCMDPVDYVYGVLGMLQIKIPRLADPDEVWRLFLSEMDKLLSKVQDSRRRIVGILCYRISDRAYKVDLRKAKDMADVYRDLTQEVMIPQNTI